MSNTVNFTRSIDRDLLRRAKVIAAKTDTSVNAWFNTELRYLVETFEAAEQASNQNFQLLLDFSLGRSDSSRVLAALDLEFESHPPQVSRYPTKSNSQHPPKLWLISRPTPDRGGCS